MGEMKQMKRAIAREEQERRGQDRFASTIVIAAAIIAAVRLARDDVSSPSQRVSRRSRLRDCLHGDCAEDDRGSALHHLKALGQKRRVARVHLDVVRGSAAHLKADALTHDERHGFGFRLAHGGGGLVRRSVLCRSS